MGKLLDILEPQSPHRDNGNSYFTYIIGLLSEPNKIMIIYVNKDFFCCCKQVEKDLKKKSLEKIMEEVKRLLRKLKDRALTAKDSQKVFMAGSTLPYHSGGSSRERILAISSSYFAQYLRSQNQKV